MDQAIQLQRLSHSQMIFNRTKQYSLTLNIGLKAITFDAEVSNWDAESTTNPDAVDISVK